jgi:ankyrin repeat protein
MGKECFEMNRRFLFCALIILGLVPETLAQDKHEDLREAVRTGNTERVKSLLKSGADVNAHYENQFTPIYFADDIKVVELLVEQGAKLNIRDSSSLQTPMERAAENFFLDEKRRDNWKATSRCRSRVHHRRGQLHE